ncbi:hypothetical protein AAEX63_10880 [Luteococcus sp. H138]|uniref:hypothetical protein n=1 Tax=unclassified Luteococcus TaxID=2639923 RepID=UPI00313E877E
MDSDVPREEFRAALEARKELGPDMEDAVVDSFVAKVESALEKRQQADPPAPDQPKSLALAIVSVVMGASMLPVGMESTRGALMLAMVWMGIIVVNVLFNGRGRK